MHFIVEFPVTGTQVFVVEANSKDDAIKQALLGHAEDSWVDTDIDMDANAAQVRHA